MRRISLDDIKRSVDELALKINASTELFPTYGYSRDFAYPHIEVDKEGFLHYIKVEKGQEISHKTTNNLDDLLFWIFSDITDSIAFNYEYENRNEEMDYRRIRFAKQEELISVLNFSWVERIKEEQRQYLIEYPFLDLAERKAKFCEQLREQGYFDFEITELVDARYPKK